MSETDPLTPERVAEWIRRHPDLLCRFPDLIDELQLPEPKQAVSLAQHRALRLRQQNEQLEQRLRQLAAIAGENERLMQRLHQLTLEVMSAPCGNAFVDRVLTCMGRDFKADEVRLHLVHSHPELAEHAGVVIHDGDLPEWLDQLVSRDETYCGRLTRQKLGKLFPAAEVTVGSCALVPVAGSGLLAVGAVREDHFHPGIGTLFLDLLGNTIAWRLKLVEQDDRKRA
ncbi:DUF484 family protein [Wenzhouxiangella limi]|uniref:DUF484 family protein n=1 Tax=Wenzhouxiangella limi TaxID=2707351 RepID=A0A845VAV4_9GAMM|nr:DUF484 family protein [Wenzhouxiangella limi]NDY94449.1 DUF484 family protein [Wenzhouxiangella limi]